MNSCATGDARTSGAFAGQSSSLHRPSCGLFWLTFAKRHWSSLQGGT